MENQEKKVWRKVLILGVVSLISILTPASFKITNNYQSYTFLFGYYYLSGENVQTIFTSTTSSIRLISGIFCTVLVVIAGIFLITSSMRLKKTKNIDRKFMFDTSTGAILLIISAGLWMILRMIISSNGVQYFLFIYMGFGLLGPLISGILILKIRRKIKKRNNFNQR